MLLDTEEVKIKSEAELLRYCYQVAGTVGLLMCDLFEVKDPVARHHAIDLGVAMQLTNIYRDVKRTHLMVVSLLQSSLDQSMLKTLSRQLPLHERPLGIWLVIY